MSRIGYSTRSQIALLGEAKLFENADIEPMQPAAHQTYEPLATAWRVSREGDLVAELDVREEGGGVVVSTTLESGTKPYRFNSLEAADTFVRDLTASFAYLGCDVVAG